MAMTIISGILLLLACYVTVTKADCPSLSAPQYGYLSTTSVFVDTTVFVFCESGFVTHGVSNVLTCLYSNQWDFPVPLCVVDCSYNFIFDVDPFTGASKSAIVPRIELSLVPYSGAVAGVQAGNTVAYSYFGHIRIPAPTILMRAGHTCTVRIINKLSNPPVGDADYGICPYFKNGVHCVNTTNLHVHGLHVAPQEDNVGLAVSPGTYYDYVYHIPDDHHAGTFWYHSHFHGSINALVGVVAGAIIMEQNEFVLPTPREWANLYADQRLVIFHYIGSNSFPSDTLPGFFSVNGASNPSININSNSWTLFRFVHAAGQHQALSLTLIDPSDTCQMRLVARDGIPQYIPFVAPSNLIVPQGGRADVALYCGSLAQGMNVTMQSIYNSSHVAFLHANDVFAQTSLFTLNVQPPPYTHQFVPRRNKPLPPALKDLTNANAAAATNITLSFTTGISGVIFAGMAAGAKYINSVPLKLNEVYSYGITADLAFIFHPYHQHVNALQIQNYIGAIPIPDISRPGEWRDVLPIHGNIIINVKQMPVDFWGQQVLHCHIFAHEEAGMMGLIRIAEPDTIYCTDEYRQRGYIVSGCGANTAVNTSCTAICADDYSGTVSGSVSCRQVSKYIARGAYSGSFSGCSSW